jgi:peptide/nickel transport system permease protein
VTTFIIRRLIQSLIVLVLVSIIVFLALRLLPGDPIRLIVTSSEAQSYTEEQIAQLRHQFGLDRPLPVQYVSWVGGLFRGDMGVSIFTRTPVKDEIFRRLPITFHLGVITFIIGLIIGIPVGIISAIRRGKWLDQFVITMSNLGITIPTFWLGLLLMYFFGLYLKWLPIMGYTSPFEDWWLSTRQLIMPVFCLCVFPIASMARQTRSSMLEVMRQDYIRTAWAKGLKERVIIIRHALKNGLIPIITVAGMGIPMIVGGTVVIETVFNIPGMGRLAVASVQNQDYPYVQGIILIISTAVVMANLIVDVTYGWADPRIRFN